MPPLDLRLASIPLFIGGAFALIAGLLGALVVATTSVVLANPLGMAAVGLACIVASIAITIFRQLAREAPPDPEWQLARAERRSAFAGATMGLVAAALVLYATLGPGAGFLNLIGGEGPAAPLGLLEPLDITGPLSVEELTGTLEGIMLPIVGGAGTSSLTHDLVFPANASAARLELDWAPETVGADTLRIQLDALVDGAWREVASAEGAPKLVLDAELPANVTAWRATVSLVEGSGALSQTYDLYVTTFAGTVPTEYEHAHD